MAIEFRKEVVQLEFLDPTQNFSKKLLPQERRIDPLTGHTSILHPGRYRKMDKPDLSTLIQRSKAGCPFCPPKVDQGTPKFSPELFPEGRICIGEARLFPNSQPWLQYNAIAVLSSQHFIEPSDLTKEIITNGFLVCQIYLNRLKELDAKAKYCFVIWNHLPPAGATLIHPHLQAFATHSGTNYHRQLLKASQRYYSENGSNFWSDLIIKEKELGERYIATIGNTVWLTNFVSKGWVFDITVVFPGRDSFLELPSEDFDSFSEGLIRVFRYIRDQNLSSFNVNLFSGIKGEGYFWTQARIVPRISLPPFNIPDCSMFELLHDEVLNLRYPEEVCLELKEYFL